MAAITALMIVTGINGSPHVAIPTERGLWVIKQNIAIPQIILTVVPRAIPKEKQKRNLLRYSVPRPMTYAINGKDSINPEVGPVIDCQPPVKFANTGSPIAPNST